MLSTPPLVQAQLSEALAIICGHDFPNGWPNLLPELVQRLEGADLPTINGVLATANSIFKRWVLCRHCMGTGLLHCCRSAQQLGSKGPHAQTSTHSQSGCMCLNTSHAGTATRCAQMPWSLS
jgi:hypothetical protein